MSGIEWVGTVAAVVMPFWNIPLILRIWKRKSADDISLAWVIGVWVCVMGMLPASMISKDLAFKILGNVNAMLFSSVFLVVLKFHPLLSRGKKTSSDSL